MRQWKGAPTVSVERSQTRGRYDYLLDELNPGHGRQIPETNLDPVHLRTFLEALNDHVAELDKLDLPDEYMQGINQVLDDQVSLAFGKKVQVPGEHECEPPGEQVVPPIVCPNPVPPTHGQPTTGENPTTVGKVPAGMPKDLWDCCVTASKKTGVDPYILAAQMEKESRFGAALVGSPSCADGLMQVEPSTRAAYTSKFQEKIGHAYNHNNKEDQVSMAALILAEKGGSSTNMLQKYNGGDNWVPGTCDSYGREIKAQEYAASVIARAAEMRNSAA